MSNNNFELYENLNSFDFEEFCKAAGSTSWPKGKRYTVKLNGKEFKIQTYFSKLTKEDMPTYGYDQYEAIESMVGTDASPEVIRWEGEKDAEYAVPEFNRKKLNELTNEQIEQRSNFIIAVANLINNQETMEAIVNAAKKKKNGTLHKNRVLRIASSGIADYMDSVNAIVARSKSDLTISVTFEWVRCKPYDNDLWAEDFISTYHDGLDITNALESSIKK